MSADRDAIRTFLDDNPAREHALREILAIDQTKDTWTFDDIPVDSGTFGELVNRGIVTKHNDEYALADPDLVSRVLDDDSHAAPTTPSIVERLPQISRPTRVPRVGFLVSAVATFSILFLFRTVTYGAVFRDGNVVLPANDPYHFRYHTDRLVNQTASPWNASTLELNPGRGYPLTYQLDWWLADLVGGDPAAVATVSAWAPVLAALLTGLFVYYMGVFLTNDRRIGLASVLMLAFIPVHAIYSGLAFFDHHAYDYVALALTGAALMWLAHDITRHHPSPTTVRDHLRTPLTWFVTIVLGLAVATQILLWSGAPLLFGAFALYVTIRSLGDRRHYSPLVVNLPILIALLLATLLTHYPHSNYGWHHPVVAYTPLLLAAGSLGVLLIAELGYRIQRLPTTLLAITDVALLAAGTHLLRRFRPDYWDRLRARADDLFFRVDIVEVKPLFTAEYGVMFGPFYQFGLVFYLGLATLILATWYTAKRHRPTWYVIIAYAWYHILIAAIQVRFAAELSPFIAVLAGVAFVYLLASVDIVSPPTLDITSLPPGAADRFTLPNRQQALYLVLIVFLVGGFSFVFIPSFTSAISITDAEYDAAMWIQHDVDERGIEHRYPVVSEWDETRFWNYWATGTGDRQGHPAIGRNYGDFIASSNPDDAFDQLNGRAEYVITTSRFDEGAPPDVTQTRLHTHYGSATDDYSGTAHFQATFISPDQSIAVFRLVPGAHLTATNLTTPNETLTLEIPVTASDTDFTYTRRTTTDPNGNLSVRVAHPGTYTIDNVTVTVPPDAVTTGNTITLPT